ncbi:MAG: thioesterase family protein [Firmicutes bacterium]|jgi:predicted thioesterase|nr:thioesterase family protein [Bacillota bacterium]
MDFNLKLGLRGHVEKIVEETDTAVAFGSGDIHVFATPMMVGIMENSALVCVDEILPKDYSTVGSHISVSHIAATPVGMKVTAEAELVEIDNKKLVFKVVAFDEKEKIGEGSHTRYIVNVPKFLERTSKK